MDLMWFLFLAHLIGDYALQSDRMAAAKCHDIGTLTWHVTIYVACIAATLWSFSAVTSQFIFLSGKTVALLAALFAIHWTQDYVKGHHFSKSKQAYYVDQVVHLVQLYAIRLLVV
jgi:hypothetical protein